VTPADLLFEVADPDRHADLLDHWLTRPHVAPWWGEERDRGARLHLETRHGEDHVVPWIVSADGMPFGYVETYRPAEDPLAEAYPFTAHDRGWHVLVGPAEVLGSGLPRLMGGAVLERLLGEPGVGRVICEPDERNHRMIRFCQALGYQRIATLDLPNKTAALLAATAPATRGDRRPTGGSTA
jgi:acetyl CoA:N6-hydroxylysine acetyl transferase